MSQLRHTAWTRNTKAMARAAVTADSHAPHNQAWLARQQEPIQHLSPNIPQGDIVIR